MVPRATTVHRGTVPRPRHSSLLTPRGTDAPSALMDGLPSPFLSLPPLAYRTTPSDYPYYHLPLPYLFHCLHHPALLSSLHFSILSRPAIVTTTLPRECAAAPVIGNTTLKTSLARGFARPTEQCDWDEYMTVNSVSWYELASSRPSCK